MKSQRILVSLTGIALIWVAFLCPWARSQSKQSGWTGVQDTSPSPSTPPFIIGGFTPPQDVPNVTNSSESATGWTAVQASLSDDEALPPAMSCLSNCTITFESVSGYGVGVYTIPTGCSLSPWTNGNSVVISNAGCMLASGMACSNIVGGSLIGVSFTNAPTNALHVAKCQLTCMNGDSYTKYATVPASCTNGSFRFYAYGVGTQGDCELGLCSTNCSDGGN